MAISERIIKSIIKNAGKRSGRRMFCSAVIAAAGSSERMSGDDKLFLEICGVPVLAHTLTAFQKCDMINEIIVVVREGSVQRVTELCKQYGIDKAGTVMIGGQIRSESVLRGLLAVSDKAQLIAIHDGARPCVTGDIISKAVAAAAKNHAAAPAVNINSTVKRVKVGVVVETVDRVDLAEIQTPQVFAAELIKAALTDVVNKSIDVTDDCMAIELLGVPVYVTEGSSQNIKITTVEDVRVAEAILKQSKVES